MNKGLQNVFDPFTQKLTKDILAIVLMRNVQMREWELVFLIIIIFHACKLWKLKYSVWCNISVDHQAAEEINLTLITREWKGQITPALGISPGQGLNLRSNVLLRHQQSTWCPLRDWLQHFTVAYMSGSPTFPLLYLLVPSPSFRGYT